MPPLESRDHRISAKDAAGHIKRHREGIKGRPTDGEHGGSFHADQVLSILAQKGCTALRIYHGKNAKGGRSMVLLGVDAQGNDMIQGTILEECWPCPPYCNPDSLLKA